jgi:hypothetical protein
VIETRIQHRAHTLLWCIQYSDHSIRTNQLKSSYQTANDFVHFNSEVRLECAYNSGHIHFCSVLEVMTPPHYSPSYSHPSLTCLNSSNILKYPTSFTYHQYTTYCALHSRSPHNTVTYILIESCTFGLTLRNWLHMKCNEVTSSLPITTKLPLPNIDVATHVCTNQSLDFQPCGACIAVSDSQQRSITQAVDNRMGGRHRHHASPCVPDGLRAMYGATRCSPLLYNRHMQWAVNWHLQY